MLVRMGLYCKNRKKCKQNSALKIRYISITQMIPIGILYKNKLEVYRFIFKNDFSFYVLRNIKLIQRIKQKAGFQTNLLQIYYEKIIPVN